MAGCRVLVRIVWEQPEFAVLGARVAVGEVVARAGSRDLHAEKSGRFRAEIHHEF